MTTQFCNRPTNAQSVDLLPWADPYIVQLFADAQLVSEECDSQSPLRTAWEDTRAACGSSLETVVSSR